MKVFIKRLSENAVIPSYAHETDACFDLTATSRTFELNDIVEYGTGLAFEIPEGYAGLIYPRSSIYKQDLTLTNCVGVIDSGYRGEVKFKYKSTFAEKPGKFANPTYYNVGDRVGQMMIVPIPKIELIETTELPTSDRGAGGFGSSGN